jgi:subtilisin family serine protease
MTLTRSTSIANADTAGGFPMPPVIVRGIAPQVTVIPVQVLADHQMPARPGCTDPNKNTASHTVNFGTDAMIAAGINRVTALAKKGYRPMVINMSLGGDELSDIEKQAIDTRSRPASSSLPLLATTVRRGSRLAPGRLR